MKFGKVEQPEAIDFTLPQDHIDTERVLSTHTTSDPLQVYVGCAKWNKQDLKNFYPRGTKDELGYYSNQFNCIELNATFYRLFPKEQYEKWYHKTPEGFKFFPKITNNISHLKRLIDSEQYIPEYIDHTLALKEKLGTIFLQMHNNFQPKNFDRVDNFINNWPSHVPIALEFRHTDWFNDPQVADRLYHVLEENNMANVLVDTAGRRDIMHMRLTNNEAFIRFVGANHESDYTRLDDWVIRLQKWVSQGLKNIHFFIHQNVEVESPLLSAYFIQKLNSALSLDLKIPQTLSQNNPDTPTLF
ncbi:hypothetical protein GCM10011344_46470 [Dokdonia pacifica]|uniref:Uncharacterized conserved protein YecE, DUF72 family n=1 Tax=Dokdonia pacifica TaxID=1627892 RepID=A0A239D9D3_9FLAO|nr:DUF72 domain-containing protein [Dokdonia pacifica]GGG40293.1 hypothetical protein GCM10011344_46470 [Dokdonia pacifica]SNS28907.1 Uncharacterized conserved protein YecE, DUF72 family [Dokdonia pacifica]